MNGEELTLNKDLKAISESLWPMRAKVQHLGVALDIDVGTLDVLAKRPDDEALMEVIKVWLRRVNPKPTWKALVIALRCESVSERALANKIVRRHCPSEVEKVEPENGKNGGRTESDSERKVNGSENETGSNDKTVKSSGMFSLLIIAVVVAAVAVVLSKMFIPSPKDYVTAVDNGFPSGPASGQTFPHINERPTMNQLSFLERKGGGNPVRIIERIGTKHTELGTILLNDEHGVVMEIIKENARGNVEAINREMLRRWLAGSGASVTWKLLVNALVEVKEEALASDIVAALQT